MPVQPLLLLPPGSAVFIDANILVYGSYGRSQQCVHLFERCASRELIGVTLLEVVNEATHHFMLTEARERGLIPKASARALRQKAALICQLRDYWQRTEQVLGLDILFVPASEALLRQAQVERMTCGLLTNDSLIVACMRHYGIPYIASNDEDFGAISGITLCRPDDLT